MPTILSIEINSRLTQVGSSRIYLYCSTSILFVWKPIRELQSKHILHTIQNKKAQDNPCIAWAEKYLYCSSICPQCSVPFLYFGRHFKKGAAYFPLFSDGLRFKSRLYLSARGKYLLCLQKLLQRNRSKVRTFDFIKPRNIKTKHHKCQLLGSHIYSVRFFWWARRDLNPHVRNGH